MTTTKPEVTKGMREFAKSIKAPEGWSREELDGFYTSGIPYGGKDSMPGMLSIVLKSDSIIIVFCIEERVDFRSKKSHVVYSGHTNFASSKGWRSFDRLGVEDSFYSPYDAKALKDMPDPSQVIAEQCDRVVKFNEVDARRLDIPGIPYRITPESRVERTAQLKQGKSITFVPSGFGTGLRVSAKRSRHSKPMSAETAQFFDCPALYVETFDHD